MQAVLRGSPRHWMVAALWLLVAAVAAMGCTPESALGDVACEEDADCADPGSVCDDGWCVIEDAGDARLTINVEGLPAGVNADIGVQLVDGADAFEETISATRTLIDLWGGTYEIEPRPVSDGGTTYQAVDFEESIELDASGEAETTVEYDADPGSVQISSDGLPDGLAPEIELVDATGETVGTVEGEGTIDGVLPGSYAVVGAPVTDEDDTVWQQLGELSVEVTSGETEEAVVEYSAQAGILSVTVEGLPDDIDANVTISGPDGDFDEVIVESGTTVFQEATPGIYTISAGPAENDLTTFSVAEAEEQVQVTSGSVTTTRVVYALDYGSMQISADAAAGDQQLRAKVEGPDDFSTTVQGEQTLEDLVPGLYDVTFLEVQEDGRRYVPDPTTVEDVAVASGDDPAEVQTDYTAAPGSMDVTAEGLDGNELSATVSNGDGTDYNLPEDADDLDSLSPGEYTVTFHTVTDGGLIYEPTDATAVVDVTVNSDEEAPAHGVYELVDGTLQLEVAAGSDIGVLEAHVEAPDGSVQFVSGDFVELTDLTPGEYTVQFQPIEQGGQWYAPQIPGEDSASTTVDLPSFGADGDEVLVEASYSAVDPQDGAIKVHATGLEETDDLTVRADILSGTEEVATIPKADGSTLVEGLDPGEYTVQFQDVDESDGPITYNYSPSPDETTVNVPSGTTVDVTTHYTLDLASLTLNADAPEPSVPVAATITPPEGPSQYVEGDPIELNDLHPGTYSVEYHDSEDDDGVVYSPVDSSDEFNLSSNDSPQVDVAYEEADGSIRVSTTGLEEVDNPGEVATVEDSDGNEVGSLVDDTETVIPDLSPGTYTVIYQQVSVENDVTRLYDPAGADDSVADDSNTYEVDVTVSGGAEARATGDYSVQPASLTLKLDENDEVLPGDSFEADVETPDGLVHHVQVEDGEETLENLNPGIYDVSFRDVEDNGAIYTPTADSGGQLPLSSGDDPTETVSYEVVQGTIEVTSTGLDDPDDLVATVIIDGDDNYEVQNDGDTVDVDPGDYTVEYGRVTVTDGDVTTEFQPVPSEREVTVESNTTTTSSVEYVEQSAELTVLVDIPDVGDVAIDDPDDYEFELYVNGLGETIVADGPMAKSFSDVDAGSYEITKTQGASDKWGNDFPFDGLDESFTIDSNESAEHTVAAVNPTQVQTEDDVHPDDYDASDPDSNGDRSLRVVLDEVAAGSEIDFADGVEDIGLTDGELSIDGSISIFGENVTLDGSDNDDQRLMGVAIDGDDEVLIDGLTFEDAQSPDDGAALLLDGDDDAFVTLFDVRFSGNEAGGTGAVNVEDGTDAVIHAAEFTGNKASGDAGAIYVEQGAELSIDKSLFVDNEASDGGAGGAIYTDGQLHVENSTFSANEADAGGAIFFGSDAEATLLHVTMVKNEADEGGALFDESNEVKLKSSYLNENTDDADGDIETSGAAIQVESAGYNFVHDVDADGTGSDFDSASSDITNEESDYAEDLTGDGVHPLDADDSNPGYLDIPADECLDFEGDSVLTDQIGTNRPYQGSCSRGAWEEDGS